MLAWRFRARRAIRGVLPRLTYSVAQGNSSSSSTKIARRRRLTNSTASMVVVLCKWQRWSPIHRRKAVHRGMGCDDRPALDAYNSFAPSILLPKGIDGIMLDFPEPLYETTFLQSRRMCLVCARKFAESVLRTTVKEIVPLCKDCAVDWNFYGYLILKRIKPSRLIWRTLVFKILHPFQPPSLRTIWQDIKNLQAWGAKMKKWM